MTGPAERSHYQVLGVAQRATLDEIRKAHRQLARVLHPDRMAEASPAERSLAERRMREVNAAWTVLSDADRRRAYDRTLQHQHVTEQAASSTPGAAARPASGPASSPGDAGSSAAGGTAGGRPWEYDAERDRSLDVDPDEEPIPPWHFWLLRRGPILAAIVIAAGIFIFTAYAGSGDGGSTRTTLPAQDCVRVTEGRNAVPTSCDGPNDGKVVTAVDVPLDCPPGTKYVVISSEVHCVDGDAGQPERSGQAES